MALTIDQITAASYPAVLNAMRKPANQWAQHSLLTELEKQKAVVRKSLGATIEVTLDYRVNPGAAFLATDMSSTSTDKTEVLTAASYAVAELAVPITWSEGDETRNPTENQKVAFVKALLENGVESHDDLVEQALFATATETFLGFASLLPSSGQGSPGGIAASTETFWRNPTGQYRASGADIEAAIGLAYDTASKGSGSALQVSLLFSGSEPYELYNSALVDRQRFIDVQTAEGGFKQLAFRTARYVFSQFGSDEIYGINPKNFQLIMSKEASRKMLDKVQIPNAVAWNRKIYSALQLVTNNKSRGFVLTPTSTS